MSLLHETLARERISAHCAEHRAAAGAHARARRVLAARRWERRAVHAALARRARAAIG